MIYRLQYLFSKDLGWTTQIRTAQTVTVWPSCIDKGSVVSCCLGRDVTFGAGLLRINEAKKEGWEGLEDWLSDVLQMHMSVRLSSDLPRYAQIFSVIWTPQMMLGPMDTLLDSSVSVEKWNALLSWKGMTHFLVRRSLARPCIRLHGWPQQCGSHLVLRISGWFLWVCATASKPGDTL